MRVVLKIFLGLIILLIISGVGAYYYISSESGKTYLSKSISNFASKGDNKITLSPIAGNIFSDFTISTITLADAKGTWLEITNLHIKWQPKAVLSRTKQVELVEADNIILSRLPAPQPKTQTTKSSFEPQKLLAMLPEKILVKQIELPKTLSKNSQILTLAGGNSGEFYNFDLKTISGPATNISASAKRNAKDIYANININITDLSVLPMPENTSLKGSLTGNFIATGQENNLKLNSKLSASNIVLSNRKIPQVNFNFDSSLDLTAKNIMSKLNIYSASAELQMPQGSIKLTGNYSPDKIDTALDIKNIDLQQLPFPNMPKSNINASGKISGTPANPIISMNANTVLNSGNYALKLNATTNWVGKQLQFNATGTTDKASFKANGNMLAALSIYPFKTDISKETALSGTASGVIPLDMFNTILRPRGHRISGQITGDANLNGTIGSPKLTSSLILKNGEYNNAASGICLHDINSKITADQNDLKIISLTANDGSKGNLSGSGNVTITNPHDIKGKISFNKLRLFCGGLATGFVNGEVNITGNSTAAILGGNIDLGPLNVQIPGKKNEHGIPEIKTVWANADTNKTETTTAKNPIALDMKINAPNQIFVRGRGLDAEFGGILHITGAANKPEISGTFTSRRGKFNLFDRVLKLATTQIIFEGTIPPSPLLDVHATTSVTGTTIDVALTGPMLQPSLVLTSTPALPQDELLALILFGRQLQNISPFQAIKLANAARTLAGEDDGSGDLLSKSREKLGLDTLDIETDDNDKTSLNSGKYITDKVYVGVKQGKDIEDRELTTEIELTPKVSAKTGVSANGNQTVGVEWKRDY